MIVYFAYGSNMSTERLVARLGRVEVMGVARLPDFRHSFSKLGFDGSAKGNIEPFDGAVVRGVLYRIDRAQHRLLTDFEGGYRPIELSVMADHGVQAAHSYCALKNVSGLAPSPEYVAHYRAAAREHRSLADYIASLLQEIGEP